MVDETGLFMYLVENLLVLLLFRMNYVTPT